MTHVAFLRAVNVAGHARVAMSDVVKAFEKAGCGGAKSYGHAGNLFWTQVGTAPPLEEIRMGLKRLLGKAPEVIIRTRREMSAIVSADPFGALVNDKAVKSYVVFLAHKPKQVPPLPVRRDKEALELIAVVDREAYVVSRRMPGRVMYGFPNQFIEKVLGVPATTRNWSTVVKSAALFE